MEEKISDRRVNDLPLESWKEIAGYLQRDVKTVQRWEKKELLPVRRHRHKSRSSVYAYPSELDAWRDGRQPTDSEPWWWKWRRPIPALASTVALAVLLLTAGSGPQVSGAAATGDDLPVFRNIKVATGLGYRGSGVLSPDGQRLAYVSDGALWVAPAHGKTDPDIAGAPTRLTESMHAWDAGNVSLNWSPDGQWIGFRVAVRSTDGSSVEELYVISAEGGEPRRLPIEWTEWIGDVHTLRYALSAGAETLYFASGATDGTLRTYSMPTSGGPWRPLTEAPTREPALSPDGSRLAYVKMERLGPNRLRSREIWVKDLTTGMATRISRVKTRIPGSPIWSPDGSRLAFTVTEGGADQQTEVCIAAISTEGKLQGEPARFPLPKGTRMLLSGWTSDGKIGFLLPGEEEIALYKVSSAGGKAVQLTPKQAWMPAWSPDGHRIFFLGINTHKKHSSLESVPADGGEITTVPTIPAEIQVSLPSGGISLSPDGSRLCFAGFYTGSDGERGSHIFTMPVDGGAVTQLTTGPPNDYEPTWSPDGGRLAFVRAEDVVGGKWIVNLYVIPSRGGTPQRLSDLEAKVGRSPRWSPDGALIAYVAGDGSSLRVIPANGGPSKVILPEPGISRWHGIAWSPDGSTIAYTAKRRLWKIPREGGEPEEINTGLQAILTKLDWSPDGEQIAVSAQKGGQYELWLMEEFEDLL